MVPVTSSPPYGRPSCDERSVHRAVPCHSAIMAPCQMQRDGLAGQQALLSMASATLCAGRTTLCTCRDKPKYA